MFSTQPENYIPICQYLWIYDIISLFAAEVEEPKIGIWGKGLRLVTEWCLLLIIKYAAHNIVVTFYIIVCLHYLFVNRPVFRLKSCVLNPLLADIAH